MGIYDAFKKIVNPVDSDDNYDDNDYMFDDQDGNEDFNMGYEEDGYTQQVPQPQQYNTQPAPQPQQRRQAPAVQNSTSLDGSELQIKVVYPTKWDDAQQIADHLINHRSVVVNLEKNQNIDLSRRIIDFLCGVVYTIDGDLKKIATNTWLATPSNVTMSQEKNIRPQQNSRRQSDDVYDTDML